MRVHRLVAFFILVSIAGCSDGGTEGPPKATFTQSLNAEDFAFSPATLQMEAGTRTDVKVTNVGGSLHNFTVEGLGVDVDIDPGGSDSALVEPRSTGSISFYCKYHKASGMVGTLIVT